MSLPRATTKGVPPALADRLLQRLGLAPSLEPSVASLAEIYRAWCRAIPFDNVLRRVQLAEGNAGPLPGLRPGSFIQDYLDHGTGGPCAPAGGALEAMLRRFGFKTRMLLAALGTERGLRPDHATVLVQLGDEKFLLDTVILCERPIPLPPEGGFREPDPLHPVVVEREEAGWRVEYASAMTRSSAGCTVLDRELNRREQALLYRSTQESETFRRFNSALYVRRNEPDGVSIVYGGWHVVVRRNEERLERQIETDERARLLIGSFGLSPGIVSRLPEDEL